MRFLHAADLHIDSPLVGLVEYHGAPAKRLRDATRASLRNLVDLAIRQQVAFVILSGDLFDGQWRDMQTGLFTAGEFRRLRDAGITVYFGRGNHDAQSKIREHLRWPDNVREFSPAGVETFVLEDHGVALHGRGFDKPSVTFDPLPDYPEPMQGMFNIGVLHTNVDGSPDHDPYAATSRQGLMNKGYGYWALGHIHRRQMLCDAPHIAYPGNTQGRHVRETGPKGCLIVEVEGARVLDAAFHATDAVRWAWPVIELGANDGLDELYEAASQQLAACREESGGRLVAVRLSFTGRSAAHRQLSESGAREAAVAELRNRANDLDDQVWIEEVRFDTAPAIDLERLRAGGDLLGSLLGEIDQVRSDAPRLNALVAELAALERQCGAALREAGLNLRDGEQLGRWLRRAELLLVDHLAAGEES